MRPAYAGEGRYFVRVPPGALLLGGQGWEGLAWGAGGGAGGLTWGGGGGEGRGPEVGRVEV